MGKDLNQEFNTILNEVVAPVFQDNGFLKNATNFYRETGELIQTFNIQKSPWNNPSDLSFTATIGFLEPTIYLTLHEAEILPEFPTCTDALIQIRLGSLIPGRDSWYKLTPEADPTYIKTRLSKDLATIIELLERQTTVSSLEEYFSDPTKMNPYWGEVGRYAFYKKIGKHTKAKELLEKAYRKAQKPKSWFSLSEKVNGIWRDKKAALEINTFWVERIKRVAELYQEEIK